MVECQIHICQCLGFDTLGRVHHQDGAVAGRQASGYLVVKVHMARCIDQIEDIFLSILCFINNTDRLRLDRNTSFTLQIHIVQHLRLHFTFCQKPCPLNDAVCQGGFAVVDMSNDTEVADFALVKCCHSKIPPFALISFL